MRFTFSALNVNVASMWVSKHERMCKIQVASDQPLRISENPDLLPLNLPPPLLFYWGQLSHTPHTHSLFCILSCSPLILFFFCQCSAGILPTCAEFSHSCNGTQLCFTTDAHYLSITHTHTIELYSMPFMERFGSCCDFTPPPSLLEWPECSRWCHD